MKEFSLIEKKRKNFFKLWKSSLKYSTKKIHKAQQKGTKHWSKKHKTIKKSLFLNPFSRCLFASLHDFATSPLPTSSMKLTHSLNSFIYSPNKKAALLVSRPQLHSHSQQPKKKLLCSTRKFFVNCMLKKLRHNADKKKFSARTTTRSMLSHALFMLYVLYSQFSFLLYFFSVWLFTVFVGI